MHNTNTRRGFTQNNWVGQALSDNAMATEQESSKGTICFSFPWAMKFYRLGVSPTGAASKLWDTCHKAGDLSGSHPTYKNAGFTPYRHAELVSASTPLENIPNKEEILNRVQDDNRRGFTLIELLVVVLIMGILAAVAVPQYQLAVAKSRYVEAMTLGNALYQAQQIYKLANGSFADDLDALDIDIPNYDPNTKTACNGHTCCRKGTFNEIYCTLYVQGASIEWWMKEGFSHPKCLYWLWSSNQPLADKVCRSFSAADGKTAPDKKVFDL